MNSLKQRVVRSIASIAGIAAITVIAYHVIAVNAATAGFSYLLFVLIVASTWGFLEAALSSALAAALYNFYFFAPTGTFAIYSPENWVAVFALLSTSLIASRLSTVAKQRTNDALERQRDLERLYTFSRAILLIEPSASFPRQLATKLADIFDLSAVVLYDRRADERYRAGPAEFDGMDEQLREAALHGTTFTDSQRNRLITAVRLGSEPIGSLAVQGVRMPEPVLQGVANLVAIGLERARAQDLAQEIEAARKTERLRTALIDALAHEFKTPLTSIKAATTSLLSNVRQPEDRRMELLAIADEEAERLRDLIDDAIDMGRLESTSIDIEETDLPTVIREVITSLRAVADGRQIDIAFDGSVKSITADRRLIRLAIKQLLDNALKYSPNINPISIRTERKEGTVSVVVTDYGGGIPKAEQKRIFQRFYRAPSLQRQVPGSGLGLSIAQKIAEVHHGSLTVTSQPGETTFRLRLPVTPSGGDLK